MEQFGEVVITQGLTGRYKIHSMFYCNANYGRELVENDGKKYLIIKGKNPHLEIINITFTLDDKDYSVDIPAVKRFIVYTKVDKYYCLSIDSMENIKFYNGQGKDITEKYLNRR